MGLDRPIDITTDQRKTVLALLSSHLPNTTAWVYGSRVKWTSRPESDLDLVVFAKPEQERRVSDLREAFEESNLPFRVDLFVWDDVPEQFRKTIEAEHVVLVEKEERRVGGEWLEHEIKALIEDGTLEIGDGYRAKNTEFVGSGVPFARAGNIKNGFQFDDTDYFPEANLNGVGDKISKPGDVVFTSKGTVGRFAFVREDTPQFVYSPQLCFWRSRDHGLIDPRFLFFWMFGREFFVQFKGVAGQTDMAEYVSLRDQRNMHLTLPPLPEQRSIAHILGTLDDKIELNRRMNETLEAMARALFKSWFVDFDPVHAKATLKHHEATPTHGKSDWSIERARAYLDRMDPNIAALFPDSFADSELSPIPEGWEISTIGDEVAVVGGSTPSTKDGSLWGGAISWATPKDLSTLSAPVLLETARQISDTGLSKISSGLLPRGAVLLSSRAPIGYLAITEIPVAVNQGFIAMRCESRLSNVFVWLWTQANIDTILQYANGSTFQEISKRNFRPLGVAIPETDILSAFDKHARPLYKQIVKNQRESRTLAALRDGLLPKLVSGELRLPHVNRIPTRSA